MEISDSILRRMGVDPNQLTRDVKTLDILLKQTPLMILAQVSCNCEMVIDNSKLPLKKGSTLVMPLSFYLLAKRDTDKRKKILKEYRRKFKDFFNRYQGQNLDGKTLLIWRTGGIGDLVFIQPIVKYLKKTYDCKILMSSAPRFAPILQDWPTGLLDGIYSMPFPKNLLINSNYHLTFEGVIERCLEARNTNVYDLLCKTAGIEIDHNSDEFRPELIPNENCLKEVQDQLPEDFVIIQMRPTNPVRMMPEDKWARIIKRINDFGKKVVLIDKSEYIWFYDNFVKKFNLDKEMVLNKSSLSKSINHAVAIISKSNGVIGIDSSFNHIGMALNKPVLGIFGSFLGDLRLRYYKNCDWIQSSGECPKQPCFFHQEEQTQCPSLQRKEPPICLEKIDEDLLMRKFEKLMISKRETIDQIVEIPKDEIVVEYLEGINNDGTTE